MDSLTMTLIRVDACNPHVGSAERYFRSVALIERQWLSLIECAPSGAR